MMIIKFFFCFAFVYQILLFDFTYVINILNFVSVFWLTELHLWTLKFSHVCNTDNLAIFCLFFFIIGKTKPNYLFIHSILNEAFDISPIPISIMSLLLTGPTPSGVPVRIRSPISNVKY